MDSIAYKKIIAKPSLNKMKVWELIFFMFWDIFKDNEFKNEKESPCYKTEKDIISALIEHYQKHYKEQYTEAVDERLKSLTQGAISKGLKALRNPRIYFGRAYTVQKILIPDGVRDQKAYQMKEVGRDVRRLVWEENRYNLIEKKLLVDNQMCIVSDYMYIFKIATPIIRMRKDVREELGEDQARITKKALEKQKIAKNAKKIKDYFKAMIDPQALFDVSSSGKKIVVMLNPTRDSESLYSPLFKDFFKK